MPAPPDGPHAFDKAVHLSQEAPGRYAGAVGRDYWNMVGPYGGITAALMLNGVLRHPARLGQPVTLTVNYAAPVLDRPFQLTADPVRSNRQTQHWMLALRQDDDQGQATIVATATAITATPRPSRLDSELPLPAAPAPETLAPMGVLPAYAWSWHYDVRYAHGAPPARWDGVESADSLSRMWMRDSPARALDHLSLTALCDLFYPRIWRRRGLHLPAGTISMTVYLHADAQALLSVDTDFVLGQAQTQAQAGGFFNQAAHLWSRQGRILASSQQLVYYKEPTPAP